MKLNDNTYERLMPDQRFRATVEAFSRMDLQEVDRLQDTCGYVAIREHAPSYFQRLQGFMDLSMLQGIRSRDLAVTFWAAMYLEELRQSTAPEWTRAADLEDAEVDNRVGRVVARLKAVQAAWQGFCQELGLDPDMWGRCEANLTYYVQANELLGLLNEIEIDLDAAEYDLWLTTLRDRWRKGIERVRGIEKVEVERLGRASR